MCASWRGPSETGPRMVLVRVCRNSSQIYDYRASLVSVSVRACAGRWHESSSSFRFGETRITAALTMLVSRYNMSKDISAFYEYLLGRSQLVVGTREGAIVNLRPRQFSLSSAKRCFFSCFSPDHWHGGVCQPWSGLSGNAPPRRPRHSLRLCETCQERSRRYYDRASPWMISVPTDQTKWSAISANGLGNFCDRWPPSEHLVVRDLLHEVTD